MKYSPMISTSGRNAGQAMISLGDALSPVFCSCTSGMGNSTNSTMATAPMASSPHATVCQLEISVAQLPMILWLPLVPMP